VKTTVALMADQTERQLVMMTAVLTAEMLVLRWVVQLGE
jgi:hypothetical protein